MTDSHPADVDVDESIGAAPEGESRELAERWRAHLDLQGDRPVLRTAIRALIAEVAKEREREGERNDRLEGLAASGNLDTAWDAVGELHIALDRARAHEDISASEQRLLRGRLSRVQTRLHRAGLRARLAARRELLRDITHDLRVPLNSIVFLTDSLFDERQGTLTNTQRSKLGGVYSASTTLLNFVNDLLDLSRATQEDFECTSVPFSIQGVLEDVRHLVRPMAEYHGSELTVEVRATDSWRGDPRLVRRILLNLVTNALEATGEGGEVVVAIDDGDPSRSEMRRIDVADDGPGIDLDQARSLLEPGDVEGWRKLLDGTDGLGLLIIGRLVRAAGGEVTVEAEEANGTSFSVWLPFGEDASADQSDPEEGAT